MKEQELPVNQVIELVLLPGADILHRNLTRLSSLNHEELAYFKSLWKKTGAEQRLRVLSGMLSLSEEDLSIDFSSIFKLGIDDGEEDIRIKALAGLELEDKHTVAKTIIKVLKNDASQQVQIAAAKALGKFAMMAAMDEFPASTSEEIFNVLLEVLENVTGPSELRRRALEAIAPFQQELIENYIEDFYDSGDPKMKASAIYAMGRNCNTRWVNFLSDEMQSSSSEMRFEAARASGEIEDEEAVPALIRLLDDSDAEVQEAAISALGKIGGTDASQALQKLKDSPIPEIKAAAVAALIELQACEDPLSLNF